MLVLVSTLAVGLAAGYVSGGRLRHRQHLRLARAWLAVAALGLQVVAFTPLAAPLRGSAVVSLHLVSYALLAWFVLANRRCRGLLVAGAGMGLNFAAIAANGGYMPASRAALRLAGVTDRPAMEHNSTLICEGTRLPWLGGVVNMYFFVPSVTLFQQLSPREVRARVMSARSALLAIAIAVSYGVATILTASVAPRVVLDTAGVLLATVTAAAGATSPQLRTR